MKPVFPKLRIEEAAARKQARIDSGQDIIVGVNKYRLEEEDPIATLEVDNQTVRLQQIERLNHIKTVRDTDAVNQALLKLTKAAKTSEDNLFSFSHRCSKKTRYTRRNK